MTATIDWPDVLPRPLLDTHAFAPRPSVVRTDMEQGAARQRKRATSTPTDIPFSLTLADWQMAVFEKFAADKALYGAEWFNIKLQAPTGYVNHEARLKGELEYKELTTTVWRVTGTMEVRERPMLSDAEYDAIIAAGGPPAAVSR